jgi:hypothetical protein
MSADAGKGYVSLRPSLQRKWKDEVMHQWVPFLSQLIVCRPYAESE